MRMIVLLFVFLFSYTGNTHSESNAGIEKNIDKLLSKMTLAEKIGQMNQFTAHMNVTGPGGRHKDFMALLKAGMLGSVLNLTGTDHVRELQRIAVDSTRMGIPLIFGLDVIHGYRTIFPIPIAEACSWDLQAIESGARVAATEAASVGINWTFAPMVDISRDARWGRVMEGAGEDPYYGSLVAKARVKGFQGGDLSADNTILACAKHFAAYGLAEAGRDYNTVDISETLLRNVVLPPFKAAVEAGCATVMTAFNDVSGIPATGNAFLIRDILKGEWGFQGFTVSDFASVGEMINHNFAADTADAARLGLIAGCDMEMESRTYVESLSKLVAAGKINEKLIDDAVRRILRMKYSLGLFDNPFGYCDAEREKKLLFCRDHLERSLDMARKSVVLLKNENQTLPLNKKIKSIALIGPFADSRRDPLGNWQCYGDESKTVTLVQGIKNKLGEKVKINYALGCDATTEDKSKFAQAIKAASISDAVVLALGEPWDMSGENTSRVNISIPGVQEELLKEIHNLGKPYVVILHNGRPLTIHWLKGNSPAIIEAWHLGSRSGDALADVLFGDYNPSGKLVMSFPRAVGQCPIYYNHTNTGRPFAQDKRWTTKYIDESNDPLYPFGFGLSYTSFAYSDLKLSSKQMRLKDSVTVEIAIRNTGKRAGEEVVQLYIRDMAASVIRPVKELKAFRKIFMEPGEKKTVSFVLKAEDLSFWNRENKWVCEPGDFRVFAGTNSEDCLINHFTVIGHVF